MSVRGKSISTRSIWIPFNPLEHFPDAATAAPARLLPTFADISIKFQLLVIPPAQAPFRVGPCSVITLDYGIRSINFDNSFGRASKDKDDEAKATKQASWRDSKMARMSYLQLTEYLIQRRRKSYCGHGKYCVVVVGPRAMSATNHHESHWDLAFLWDPLNMI